MSWRFQTFSGFWRNWRRLCFHPINERLSSWTPERHFTLCSAIVLRRHHHVSSSSLSCSSSSCSFSSSSRVSSLFFYQLPSTMPILSIWIKLCVYCNWGTTLRSLRHKISTFQLLVLFACFLSSMWRDKRANSSCDQDPVILTRVSASMKLIV